MLEWGTNDTPNNGRVALVTGAARGIGLGISAWLITEGWQVVLADVDRERGSKVARVLGNNAWFVAMDVAKEDQVSVGVAEILGQFGRLDALVCNAAISDPHTPPLESLDLKRWNRTLAVNLTGAMLLAKRQQSAFGAVVSFEVKGGKEAAWRFIDATKVISITTNLGDTKTTIAHPATTSHGRLSPQERANAGIRDNLIRVAVGLEDVADLKADLSRGLAAL